MDHHGSAPELTQVADMIDRVSDRNVQAVLREMQAQNVRHYRLYEQSMLQYVDDIKSTVRSEIQSLVSLNVCAPPVPLNGMPYPEFIQASIAMGRNSSGQSSPHVSSSQNSGDSLSATSSLTDRPDIVRDNGQIMGMKCLFCTHYHFLEKSHYQHLDRLLTRLEKSEPYSGKCVIPDTHWLYLSFGVGDSKLNAVRLFIRKYLSFLQSGNEKGIHPDRAIRLITWLDSLPRA
jgi:hypothetical protein